MKFTYDLPRILGFLSKSGKVKVGYLGTESGFRLYEVDLSKWRLKFSDRTPFIVIKEENLATNLDSVWAALLELVEAHDWQYRFPIIIVEGSGDRLKHRVALVEKPNLSVAVLDNDVADAMASAEGCRYPMLDALLQQIPRRDLLPYETASPVTGSAFFGRESELRRLIRSNSSYAVTGPRRIGKTSLLLEAKRQLEKVHECLFIKCSNIHDQQEFMREMIRLLRRIELRHMQHDLFSFADFLSRMPRYKHSTITLFLDEVDQLLYIDKRGDYNILNALRDARAATNGGWHFILAGSTALRDEHADENSPMKSMVHLITMKPFTYNQAFELMSESLNGIQVKIRKPTELVRRIHLETGGHPNLIQHYCRLLADLIEEQNRSYIESADLNEVYKSIKFRNHVLRLFEINSDLMQRLIVYLMADQRLFNQSEIDRRLKTEGVTATFSEIDKACDALEHNLVLKKIGRIYQFNLKILPTILRKNCNLEYLVMKTTEVMGR